MGKLIECCKKHWRPLVVTLLLVLLVGAPFLVTVFVSFDVLHYVNRDNQWIGFWGNYFGGIIGGIITVIIFNWTIENNKIERQEEHRIQVLPAMGYKVLKVEQRKKNTEYESVFNILGFPDKNLCFELNIKNIGLGSAQEFCRGDWHIGNIVMSFNGMPTMILQGDEISIPFILDFPDEKDYNEEIGQAVLFSLMVTYKDIFGNKYKQEIPFRFFYLKYYEGEERKEKVDVEIVNLKQAILVERASV